MSVNVHLYLYVEELVSTASADAVETALWDVLKNHGIDSWMQVGVFHTPPWVKASSEHGPIIVRGFGAWSTAFERDVTAAVRAIAPDAAITVDWDHPDEA